MERHNRYKTLVTLLRMCVISTRHIANVLVLKFFSFRFLLFFIRFRYTYPVGGLPFRRERGTLPPPPLDYAFAGSIIDQHKLINCRPAIFAHQR